MGLDAEVGGGFGNSEGVSVEDGNNDVGNDPRGDHESPTGSPITKFITVSTEMG